MSLSLLWVASILDSSASAQSPAPPLFGELTPGTHAVGFSSTWDFDHGRRYRIDLEDGTRYGVEGKSPRPVLINTWYPAAIGADDAPRMRHRDYLSIDSADPRLASLASGLVEYAQGVIEQYVIQKDADAIKDRDREVLGALLDRETAAVRDAAPADGRFPLVVYHSGFGSSFEDNAVLCEYLASHGYVVIGSPFLDGSGESLNVDSRDASSRDVEHLIRHAVGCGLVDGSRVAMIGHSGGAHASLWFASHPSRPLDAVVCLDTTQDYHSFDNPLWKALVDRVLSNVDHFTVPLLMAAEPHAYFALGDSLPGCDRTYLTLPSMNHDTFVAQGVMHVELAERTGRSPWDDENEADPASVRRSYCELNRVVLTFLNHHLRGGPPPRTGVGSLETAARGATAPERWNGEATPSPRQIRPCLADHGATATAERLRALRDTNPAHPVFHREFAAALLYELHAKDDRPSVDVLWSFFQELHPALARSFLSRARFYLAFDGTRRDYAVGCLQTAQWLDPDLTEEIEALLREHE